MGAVVSQNRTYITLDPRDRAKLTSIYNCQIYTSHSIDLFVESLRADLEPTEGIGIGVGPFLLCIEDEVTY